MENTKGFKPWRLDWTGEHIQRFWAWRSSDPSLAYRYFSNQVGDSILEQASQHIPLNGTVVDLGAGPGYLVEKLLRRGVDTLALDSSAESIASLTKRLEGQRHFLGARVGTLESMPVEDGLADILFLIETIEHLGDGILDSILSEIYRILKPGGYVVITTPNEENLKNYETMCPNCGCQFHTVQHMRSWSADSLSSLMRTKGFSKIVCTPTLFSPYSGKLVRSSHKKYYEIRRRKLLHLLYVGQVKKL